MLGMKQNKETMEQAGYVYIKNVGDGGHLLRDKETGKLELWFCNKGHASYGIKWRNTDLEFARSL